MHSHRHGAEMGTVLKWSLAATVLLVVIEAVAGIEASSLALLSDAGHDFTQPGGSARGEGASTVQLGVRETRTSGQSRR